MVAIDYDRGSLSIAKFKGSRNSMVWQDLCKPLFVLGRLVPSSMGISVAMLIHRCK